MLLQGLPLIFIISRTDLREYNRKTVLLINFGGSDLQETGPSKTGYANQISKFPGGKHFSQPLNWKLNP